MERLNFMHEQHIREIRHNYGRLHYIASLVAASETAPALALLNVVFRRIHSRFASQFSVVIIGTF